MNKKAQLAMLLLMVCALSAGLIIAAGCKSPYGKHKSASMEMQQTTCPVSGKPISKKYSTEDKGKTEYFCCPNCKPSFEKPPQKYVSMVSGGESLAIASI